MSRPMVLLVVAVLVVLFFGFVGIPWLKNSIIGNKMDVRIRVISAVVDDKVNVPGTNDTVSRIVVEMEILFPYGSAPDGLGELSFRGDDGNTVDVNWGNSFDKKDLEDQSLTKWTFGEVFFPIDFKQGWLQNKNRELFYLRMPRLPYNPPPPKN